MVSYQSINQSINQSIVAQWGARGPRIAETEEGACKAASRRRKAGEVEVVVSKSRVQILKACHNDPTTGHHGHSTNSIWLCPTCGN